LVKKKKTIEKLNVEYRLTNNDLSRVLKQI